jgi:hypothetical protein
MLGFACHFALYVMVQHFYKFGGVGGIESKADYLHAMHQPSFEVFGPSVTKVCPSPYPTDGVWRYVVGAA